MRSSNHLPCSLLEFYKGAASECVAQGVVLYRANFTKGLPLSVLHKASCYTGRLMLLGCFFLQAAAKAKATMSASLMRRWATAQKTKLKSACNAATQVNAAQPLLDLACGKMGSFFPPLGWVKHLLPLDPA